MTDTEIETFSALLIMLSCTVVIGGTVVWWVFLQTFKMVDDYLQDRQFREKMKSEDGTVWYVGYKD